MKNVIAGAGIKFFYNNKQNITKAALKHAASSARSIFPEIMDFVLSLLLGYYVCFFSIDWYNNQWLWLLKTHTLYKLIRGPKHFLKII